MVLYFRRLGNFPAGVNTLYQGTVMPSPCRNVLTLKDSFSFDESVGALSLNRISLACGTRLEKPLEGLFFVLPSQAFQLITLPVLLSQLLGFKVLSALVLVKRLSLFVGSFLLGSRGLSHFDRRLFQSDFYAHRLDAFPRECCGKGTNEHTEGDFQNVIHP